MAYSPDRHGVDGQPRSATYHPVETTQSPLAHRPWWKTWDAGILWLLIAVTLIPLWTAINLPTQDGPIHIANAVTLMHYDDPAWETARQYYELNDPRFPTWLINSLNLQLR